ncbi:PepSY-associated TM helix domain-containing protein [Streptomyces sp. TLI_146]|uniref:PepSY-associated TM helix domain-containing protein n=1 Tax=Streptomyces sp. TLI_146 TaxID=1938858 RepID=UPI00214CA0A1|nr:PepSY-associated TM helix domain-containing protein [Streptomyces sp. TLI_146]
MPDEEWERFLRESADGVADAPKEPSARARMVARRLREEPESPQVWRGHSPARPRRRKQGWYVVGFLASLVLLVVALSPGLVVGWFGDDAQADTPLAAESGRPDQPPPTPAAERPTLDQPFRGSPAARWADNAAGITVPEAKATGWMSTAEVAQALGRTRDFLVAASLDSAVLNGDHPTKAIARINPHQKDVQDYLSAAFRTPTEKNDPLLLFSRFDKTRTRLVGDVVKTRGRMTYQQGERGALQVSTDITYVYPVVRAAAGSDEVERTIVRREVVVNWDNPAKVITEPGTFSVVSYKVHITNGGCGTTTGYLVPTFGAGNTAGTGDGPGIDPYDRSAPLEQRTGKGCGLATRT